MSEIEGVKLATWDKLIFDSNITAGKTIGVFKTKDAALGRALTHKGAEVIIQLKDGYQLNEIDDGSKYTFTRDNLEQVKDYPVSSLTTKGAHPANIISFVTEDDYELVSPQVHKNPMAKDNYIFPSNYKLSIFTPQKTIIKNASIEEIKSKLTPNQLKEFLKLDKTQQEQYQKVFNKLLNDVNLKKLLENGMLTLKDFKGNTLLYNISCIATQKIHPRLDGGENTILDETIYTVLNPGCIQQNNKNTCPATTAEYIIAKKYPAEFTRIVSGLTSVKGEVTLVTGSKMKLGPDAMDPDDSYRSNIDRIIQSSFMNFPHWIASYDNQNDKGRFYDVLTGDAGLFPTQMNTLMEKTTGENYTTYMLLGGKFIFKKVEDAVNKGQLVPIGMNFAPDQGTWIQRHIPAGHELTLTKINYDKTGKPISVELRNPWGGYDHDPEGKEGPRRIALDNGGMIRMTYEDFVKRLNSANIPS